MKIQEIYTKVTQQTYDKLFNIAEKENKHISKVIEEILAKETNTPTIEKITKAYKETH